MGPLSPTTLSAHIKINPPVQLPRLATIPPLHPLPIREHSEGILAAIRLGINNGRIEGLNNRVRLIVRRGFGFHTATAALALVMLSCGPIELHLPHEQPRNHPHP